LSVKKAVVFPLFALPRANSRLSQFPLLPPVQGLFPIRVLSVFHPWLRHPSDDQKPEPVRSDSFSLALMEQPIQDEPKPDLKAVMMHRP